MANNILSAAPTENPLRRYFSRYFKARWQNYQNVVTDDVFFSQMPAPWLTYQQTYVRQWDEWTRGFVLQLHKGDFFSVGMGKTVCDILTRECTKGRFRFDGEIKQSVDFITKWADDNRFSEFVSKGFMNANRLGNTIGRLNVIAGAGECYPSIHSVDRTYFEINRRDEIIRARFVDYLSADTVGDKEYHCVEDRVFMKGVPYYRVIIMEATGTVTSQTINKSNIVFNKWNKGANELDPFTLSKFKDLYGDIELGVWYELPFADLGCYNWKNCATSVAINSMPGYAESSIHTAIDILYSIDYNWSMGQMDMYWGRTRVLVPREMRPTRVRMVHDGKDFGEVMAMSDTPLDDDLFSQLPSNGSVDDKQPQPIFVQPDLRGEAHKFIRDADLELLASKVGLSSSTLANHLNNFSDSKTATQVNAETSSTDITVATKRELAEQCIKKMLREVLKFYMLPGRVDLTWNQNENNNMRAKEQVIAEYSGGVMPLDEAVKRLHPELTQEEVNEWVKKLEAKEEFADIFAADKNLTGSKYAGQ